jgi:hypothetical protein
MTEFLQTQELHQLTGYARPNAQVTWLKEKGVAFRQDGRRVIVSREHVRNWLAGRNVVHSGGLNLAGIK